MPELLDENTLSSALTEVPLWRREGQELVRELKFPTYLAGADFVARVAQVAEGMNHHPDILLAWRKVTLRISTHSKGGLTALDFDFTRKVEQLTA